MSAAVDSSLVRVSPRAVALETTLLLHGVPREAALSLARGLSAIVRAHGVEPAIVGLVAGRPVVGLDEQELRSLLNAPCVPKANSANLGILMHRRSHGATTVSATMELAHGAGIRVFATGGIGGVHPSPGRCIDISSDLAALARYPVAVVTSGTKGLLDVPSTRELLETLGVPVVGWQTDEYPAFYVRHSGCRVDARFDAIEDLASFVSGELARTGRGILVANPIPQEHAVDPALFDTWLEQARERTGDVRGRDVTPAILAALHEISGGRTLEANLALVRANAELSAALCARMSASTL